MGSSISIDDVSLCALGHGGHATRMACVLALVARSSSTGQVVLHYNSKAADYMPPLLYTLLGRMSWHRYLLMVPSPYSGQLDAATFFADLWWADPHWSLA